MTIMPPLLQKGDCIGVVAPSSKWDASKVQKTLQMIEVRGFKAKLHEQTNGSYHQFAGKPDEKIAAIHEYFQDPNIQAIFCLVGGNGALHILNELNYDLIKQNPKILMGFSDITALLNSVSSQTGLVTFHGPTLTNFGRLNSDDQNQCFDMLSSLPDVDLDYDKNIEASGTLIGGNLSVLQALIGTPYAPPVDKDNILLIEDTNDHLSRYDRMIAHMKLAGWFKNTKAILLGEFLNTQDNKERPFGFTMREILAAHAPNVPVIENIPVGHGDRLITLPIGAEAILKNGILSFKAIA